MAIETKTITIDPKKLTTADSASIKNDPSLKLFYQPRHDVMPDQSFVEDIKTNGILQKPWVTKFNGKMVVAFGTRRVNAAKMAGLDSIKVEQFVFDPDVIRDIQVAENEQRVENSLHDKLHNILAYLNLDPKTNKPRGLSYAEVGSRFSYSHQTIRDLAQLAQTAPKWMITAVDEDHISYTEALKLVKANKAEGGDNDALKEKFKEWRSTAQTSKSGKPRQNRGGGTGGARKKLLARDLIEHWAYSNDTPVAARVILQVVLTDIEIDEAKSEAKGKLDWMTEKPKPSKKKTKSEEDAEEDVTEEDLEEEEEEEEDEVVESEVEDDEDEDEEYEEEDEDEEEDEEEEEEEEEEPVRPTRKAPAKGKAKGAGRR